MKTALRVLLELFGPSIIGTLAAMVLLNIRATASGEPIHDVNNFFSALFGVEVFALLYSGIQAIWYTLVMEYAFSRGLKVRSMKSIILSTVLGILSGASFVFYGHGYMKATEVLLWCAIGAIVGSVLSCILYLLSPKDPRIT